MAAVGARVTVTTSSTEVVSLDPDGSVVWLYNPSGSDVHLGGSAVTSATGFTLTASTRMGPVALPPGNALYGVTSSGTQVVHVLTVGR